MFRPTDARTKDARTKDARTKDARTKDAYAFARQRGRLAGTLSAAGGEFPRIASLGAAVGPVEYAVRGGDSALGKPALHVQARAVATMQCQRCLEPVAIALDVEIELELAPSQQAIDTAADEVDRILGSTTIDAGSIAALVEDELILGLPMVARHPEGHCSAP